MEKKVLMKGSEALAEAAIRSGCRFFFGYPITPQTEVAAYMAKQMPKRGGTFLQAESEIAATPTGLHHESAHHGGEAGSQHEKSGGTESHHE